MLFEIEIATFKANKDALLGRALGEFVLIKGDRIIDIFMTEIDAIRQGYKRFGDDHFFVKEILPIDRVETICFDIGGDNGSD